MPGAVNFIISYNFHGKCKAVRSVGFTQCTITFKLTLFNNFSVGLTLLLIHFYTWYFVLKISHEAKYT